MQNGFLELEHVKINAPQKPLEISIEHPHLLTWSTQSYSLHEISLPLCVFETLFLSQNHQQNI